MMLEPPTTHQNIPEQHVGCRRSQAPPELHRAELRVQRLAGQQVFRGGLISRFQTVFRFLVAGLRSGQPS